MTWIREGMFQFSCAENVLELEHGGHWRCWCQSRGQGRSFENTMHAATIGQKRKHLTCVLISDETWLVLEECMCSWVSSHVHHHFFVRRASPTDLHLSTDEFLRYLAAEF